MSPDPQCGSVTGKIRVPHACVPSLRRRRCLGPRAWRTGRPSKAPRRLYYLTPLRRAIGSRSLWSRTTNSFAPEVRIGSCRVHAAGVKNKSSTPADFFRFTSERWKLKIARWLPRDLASRWFVGSERRPEYGRDQIVEEEQQLRAKACPVASALQPHVARGAEKIRRDLTALERVDEDALGPTHENARHASAGRALSARCIQLRRLASPSYSTNSWPVISSAARRAKTISTRLASRPSIG
jgi:hypothetical protein